METKKAMRKKVLCLILTLVMVAGMFPGLTLPAMAEAAPGMTVKINGTEVTGQSLQGAIATIYTSSLYYYQITSIEVTAGIVTATDWDFIKTYKGTLSSLVTLTVADTDAVTSVADLPASSGTSVSAFPSTLVTVNIAKTKSIGNNAFTTKCTELTSVSFPAATSIGNNAFTNCTALTSVSFPTATSIGNSAFSYCSALTSVSIPMATTIGDKAFACCTALTSASFPAAASCGKYIFDGCTELTSVSFPVATSINEYAFQDCTKLTSPSFPVASTISQYSFKDCTSLTSVSFPKVTSIGMNAFNNCTALTSVTIPEATTIGTGGFYNCAALPAADFPKVTSIGLSAFNKCKLLTAASFPAATTIMDNAFNGCTALASASFPAVTSIGIDSFYNCTTLTTLKLSATPPTINGTSIFTNCPVTRSLVFVNASGTELTGTDLVSAQSAYKAVSDSDNITKWHGWTIYVPLPNWLDGITSIDNKWFDGGIITTAEELASFAYFINTKHYNFGKTFTLANDIDLSGKEWTPIGIFRDGSGFQGTFDGNGHKITGVKIGVSAIAETTQDCVGLFGCNGGTGTIKNLGVEFDSYINENYVSVSGRYGDYIGSVAGFNYGDIKNCYATGNIEGGADSTIGGLVGYNSEGWITNCYATGNVSGGAQVGGFAGYLNGGQFKNCYASGNLAGVSNASIGGLFGSRNSTYLTLLNVFWNNSISMKVGGIEQTNKRGMGNNNLDNTTSMTVAAMKDPSFVTTLNNYLDIIYDAELYQWKVNTDNYPTFSGTLYSAPTKIGKAITIGATAPVTGAAITGGTNTPPAGASGPVITWSADGGATWNASGSFVAGTVYKTKYVYTADTGYQFDSAIAAGDISVTNLGSGTKNVALTDSNKTLTITVTWPATAGPAAETISGTVRDRDGNPIAGATVALTPGAGTPNPATTGIDGKYTINNVPAANYVVTVTLPNGGGSFTKNITVPGGNMDIQQPTAPTYTVSGSIQDATDSSPVSGATVTLTNTTDNTKIYTGTTDINGNYTVTGVPDGSYTVNVTKGGETYDCGNAGITVNGSNISGGSISVTIPTYTVRYDGNGATSGSVASQTTKAGSSTVASANGFSKTYFTFAGWNTAAGGGGTAYPAGSTIPAQAGNTTIILYAQWNAIGQTIAPSFTGSTATKTSTNANTVSYTLSTAAAAGTTYKVYSQASGGSVVSGVTAALSGTTTITLTGVSGITTDTTYYISATESGKPESTRTAVTVKPIYTVSYDGNGSDGGTLPTDATQYKNGTIARVMSKGNLTKSNNTFNGWNTSPTGNGISYRVNDTFAVVGNVTLYAQWKAIDSAQIPIFKSSNVRGRVTVTQAASAYELSVTAEVNDGGTLSYQWYEHTDGTTAVAISSATNSSYTPSTTSTGVTYYYVVVTNTLTTQSGVKTSTNTSSEKTVIVLAEPAASYSVSTNSTLNNITLGNTSATQYQNYTTNIIADTGYNLPDRITVTMGGRTLINGVDYIYSRTSTTTGTVTVYNVTGQIAITAEGVLIPTAEYTISFNSNGADAAVPAISAHYGDAILLPTPTKAGFSFVGWYRDSGFATSYISTTMGKENITLFARWQPITYTISGNVKNEANANVNSATVKLMAGSRMVAQATTGINGNFTISGVPAGTYNLVITKGDQTITLVITVSDNNIATGTVILPTGKKNSIVEVKKNTPDIIVDKLNDFFRSSKFSQEDSNVVDSGGTVEIRLLAEQKDESGDNAAANAYSIKNEAGASGKNVGIFLNLTVSKIITPLGGAAEQPILIDQLSDLLIIDIPLPAELQGKSGYVIYRYHGAAVQIITEVVNADGEYIEVSSDGKSIKLHTKKFSTYAVGYTAPSTPPNNNTGGSSSSSAVPSTIKTEPSEGGRIDIGTDNKTATITPDNGYAIADVIVDGKSIGATEKYSFTDGATHKISAVFVKKTTLPYYNQNSGKVYIGFSQIVGNLYKYIAPSGVNVEFKDNPKYFADNTIAWAKPSIDFVTERELFLGTGINKFSPDAGMTRAMFVAVIGRLYERSYGSISGTSTFSDVDKNAYYSKYVGWANENGIIKGVGGNRFAPEDKVTREQMAVIMLNLATLLRKAEAEGVSLTYADSLSISSWAVDGAKYCQETKVITGRDGGIFAPQDSATRAEVAAVIERFIKTIVK